MKKRAKALFFIEFIKEVKMCLNDFFTNPFWSFLGSISTFLALFVPLYLSRRKKTVRKLNVYQQFKEDYKEGKIELIITVENIGDVPIILNNLGCQDKKKNFIRKDIQKYYNGEEILLIDPKETKILTYNYKFEKPFQEGDNSIYSSNEYKLLSRAIFKAQDTLGNFYP